MITESLSSWDISYSAEDKCLFISATDYHAGPLRLSAEQLKGMLRKIDPAADPSTPPVPSVETGNSPAPARPDPPALTVSRKDRCLTIEIPDGWSGSLKLSRKDLYRYGRQMSKTARKAGR